MTTRKAYSKEFELDAVRLVFKQGYTCTETARILGISDNILERWVKENQADDRYLRKGDSAIKYWNNNINE